MKNLFNDFNIIINNDDLKSIIINIVSSKLDYIITFILSYLIFSLYKKYKISKNYHINIKKYKELRKDSLLDKLSYIETNNINDILNKIKTTLIGKAGSGKTTLLNQIFKREDSIYINLENLNNENLKDLDSFYILLLNKVYTEWEKSDKKYFRTQIEKGKLRLLIDSFEQLDKKKKESFREILKYLIREENIKFLIAGRDLDYLSDELSKISKNKNNSILINELSDEDIKFALNKIECKNTQQAILSLKDKNKNIYKLIKKPLYLNILLQVIESHQKFKIQLLQQKADFFNILSTNILSDRIEKMNLTMLNEILKIIACYEITALYNTSQLMVDIGTVLHKYNVNYNAYEIIEKFKKIGIIVSEFTNGKEIYKFFHSSYRDYYVAQKMKESDILDNYMINPKKWEEVLIMFSYYTVDKNNLFTKLLKKNELEIILNCLFEIGEKITNISGEIQQEILNKFKDIIIFNFENRNIIELLEIHIVLETSFGNRLFDILKNDLSVNIEQREIQEINNISMLLAKKPSTRIANLLFGSIINTYKLNMFVLEDFEKKYIDNIISLLIDMQNIITKIVFKEIKSLLNTNSYPLNYKQKLMNIFLEDFLIKLYQKQNNNNDIKKIVIFLIWNKNFENQFIKKGIGLGIFEFFDEKYKLDLENINYNSKNLESLEWIWKPFYKDNNLIRNLGRFSFLLYLVIYEDSLHHNRKSNKYLPSNIKTIIPLLFIKLKDRIKIPKQNSLEKITNFYKSAIDIEKDSNKTSTFYKSTVNIKKDSDKTSNLLKILGVSNSWKILFLKMNNKCQKELFLRIFYRNFYKVNQTNWNKNELEAIGTYSFEKSLAYKAIKYILLFLTFLSSIFTIFLIKLETDILVIVLYILTEFFIISGWLLFWKNPLKLKQIKNDKIYFFDIFLSLPSLMFLFVFTSSLVRILAIVMFFKKNTTNRIDTWFLKYLPIIQYPIFLYLHIYFIFRILNYKILFSLFMAFVFILFFSATVIFLFRYGINKERESSHFLSGIFYKKSKCNESIK